MQKLVFTLFYCVLFTPIFAQTAEDYYNQAIEKAQADDLEAAIQLLDKSIELDKEQVASWYNRGLCKFLAGRNEEALDDFNKTIQLDPEYPIVYLNRGATRKYLTDYDGAIQDYSKAIELDGTFGDAYYFRGKVYKLLGKKDSACADFDKAAGLDVTAAKKEAAQCSDTSVSSMPMHSILRLTKTAKSKNYGFSEKNPIKVGTGFDGGPANQHAYFNLLRDAQGKQIEYKRLHSCCPHPAEHGFMGRGMLDKYEIVYKDKKGKEQKAVVYISFYDYEEPQILHGFKTVKPR